MQQSLKELKRLERGQKTQADSDECIFSLQKGTVILQNIDRESFTLFFKKLP